MLNSSEDNLLINHKKVYAENCITGPSHKGMMVHQKITKSKKYGRQPLCPKVYNQDTSSHMRSTMHQSSSYQLPATWNRQDHESARSHSKNIYIKEN